MRSLRLALTVRVGCWIGIFAAMAGPTAAANPVQELAKLLRNQVEPEDQAAIARQQEQVAKRAESLARPSELRAALLLPGWKRGRSAVPGGDDDPLDKIHHEVWTRLAERLEKMLRSGLRAEGAERRLTAITFLAEMADEQRQIEESRLPAAKRPAGGDWSYGGGWSVFDFTGRMAGDVRKMLDKDTNADVRVVAVRAFVEIAPGTAAMSDALKPLLEPSRTVGERRAAAQGLARMFHLLSARAEARPPLEEAGPRIVAVARLGLGDKDATVRRLCLEPIRQAARQIPPNWQRSPNWRLLRPLLVAVKEQTLTVAGLLADSDGAVRLTAHQTLEDIATARLHLQRAEPPRPAEERALLDEVLKTLPGLKKSLGEDDVRIRLASLYVLETLQSGAAPAVEAVATALKDKNGFVRWGAARVLNNLAPHEADKAVPALAAALTDSNQTVRLTAVAALKRYGPKAAAALDELGKAALNDAEVRMRLGTIDALGSLGDKARPASDRLVRAVADPSAEVRAAAAKALGRLGRLDGDALRALRKALRDTDAAVRQAASATLLDDRP
jgi:hypothetical protein